MTELIKLKSLMAKGQLREAKDLCEQHLEASGHSEELVVAYGLILVNLGQTADGMKFLLAEVEQDPSKGKAVELLVQLAQQNQKYDFAAQALKLQLRNAPSNADLIFNCAYYHNLAGKYQESIDYYELALELQISSPEEVMVNMANIYSQYLANEQKAYGLLTEALDCAPSYLPALYNLGNWFEQAGNREKAHNCFADLVRIQPDYLDGLARLADLQNFDSEQAPAIRQLEIALSNAQLSPENRIAYGFSLGRAYDQCGHYRKAFEHYQTANELNRQSFKPYDAEAVEQQVERIIQTFDRNWFASNQLSSNRQPIIICGMFRSGSTLIEQILNAHPNVIGGGELDYFVRAVHDQIPDFPLGTDFETLREIQNGYDRYVDALFPKACHVTDKRPDNFLYVGLIKTLYPNAKVVLTQRDPLDNSLSVFFQRLGQRFSYSSRLEDIAHYLTQEQKLAHHWRSLFPDSVTQINYDQLVKTPGRIVGELLSFLQLDFSPDCLAFHKNNNHVKTASVWQVRQPLYQSSSGRWKNYQQFITPLLNAFPPDIN